MINETLNLRAIRRHVYQLILLVVILSLITAGYIFWQKNVSEKILSRANDYHLSSSSFYLKAMEELRHIQANLEIDLAYTQIEPELQLALVESKTQYNRNVSFYIVRDAHRAGLVIHQQFAGSEFDSLVDKLGRQFQSFKESGSDYFLHDGDVSGQMITEISSLLVTLRQLVHLHSAARDDLLVEQEAREIRQFMVFFVLVLTLFLLGVLITKRGLAAINSVIIDYSQAEEKLVRSNQEWLGAMDFLEDAIYLVDLDDKVVRANKVFYKMTGLSPAQVIGKDISTIIHPQGEAVPCPVCAARMERRDELITMEADHPDNSTGRAIDIMVRIIRDEDSEPLTILMGVHDLSRSRQAENELRESENKYRTLFDKSADAILIIEDNMFVDCNVAALKMLGFSNKTELFNTHPSKLSPPVQADGKESYVKANEMISTALEKGSHRFEWLHKRKNGEIFPVEVLLTPVSFGGKTFIHTVWRDLSQQKLTENALRRSQKMDAVGQMAGGIAHDFNNILGIVLGNVHMLEKQLDLDDTLRKRINGIKHSTQRAVDLTRQLLGFARREASINKATNINHVITNIQNLITQSLTPQVEVEYHLAEELWQTEIDPGDFEDAILNLALNARDAMNGSGLLTIETRNFVLDAAYCVINPDASPGNYVMLAISDTGEGMSQKLQDHIFEPFYTTKEQGKGTGLGLSRVYGFVKRSGGSIKIYSEPGTGATFRIYLPATTLIKKTAKEIESKPGELPGGSETLLLVDDEILILELAEETLQALGYRVLTACNGKDAMQKLAENPGIDLLFTDVVMPGGINGYDLAEKAVIEYPSIKVLLTSGYTEKAVARNGQARFNENILGKPYTPTDLAWQVRKILG